MTHPQSPGPDPKALRELLEKATAPEPPGNPFERPPGTPGPAPAEWTDWYYGHGAARYRLRSEVLDWLPGLLDRLEALEETQRLVIAWRLAENEYAEHDATCPLDINADCCVPLRAASFGRYFGSYQALEDHAQTLLVPPGAP